MSPSELRERVEALARGQEPAAVLSAVISALNAIPHDPILAPAVREAVAAAERAFDAAVGRRFPSLGTGAEGLAR